MITETGRKILLALDCNVDIDALNQGRLIFEIEKNDAGIGTKYRQFVQDYEAYQFVKQDFELKSKLATIWEIQCKSLKLKATNSFQELKALIELKNLVVEGLDAAF